MLTNNKVSLITFSIIILISLLLLLNNELGFLKKLFLLISLITTTGILPNDFENINIIESYDKYLFIFLFIAIVGTFSGTINGGVKLNKLSLFFFNIKEEFNKFLYQNNIKGINIVKKGSSQKELNAFYAIIIFSLILIFISILAFTSIGIDFKTSVIYVISALTNTGESLLILSNAADNIDSRFYFILNILMICGRFEFIGYLLLFKKFIS
tara:strand:+ start:213 stop:848 length:636 start_codon:yes stop_codon:yes gene_type:complete